MRPITPSEIIDALSCSSRCVASRHGLRPSIFFAAGASAPGAGVEPAWACSEASGMFKAMMSLPFLQAQALPSSPDSMTRSSAEMVGRALEMSSPSSTGK